jgi:hypothetical protein
MSARKFVTKRFTNDCDVVVKAFADGNLEIDMGFMTWTLRKEQVCDVNNEKIRAWVKEIYESN